jgi:hypothetical protein
LRLSATTRSFRSLFSAIPSPCPHRAFNASRISVSN